MSFKSLIEKPMLAIGILIFTIFLFGLRKDGKFGSFSRSKLKPTSCSAVIVNLKRRAPKDWKVFCEGNNLAVELEVKISEKIKIRPEKILSANYRELANNLSFIAQKSPTDILQNVFIVRLKQKSESYMINAVSEGKYLAQLKTMKSPELIKEHLQNTVQVKESALK